MVKLSSAIQRITQKDIFQGLTFKVKKNALRGAYQQSFNDTMYYHFELNDLPFFSQQSVFWHRLFEFKNELTPILVDYDEANVTIEFHIENLKPSYKIQLDLEDYFLALMLRGNDVNQVGDETVEFIIDVGVDDPYPTKRLNHFEAMEWFLEMEDMRKVCEYYVMLQIASLEGKHQYINVK